MFFFLAVLRIRIRGIRIISLDPDPGCEKIRYGSGSRVNFDTDPDPGKNDTDPDPEKRPKYQENLQKVYEKR